MKTYPDIGDIWVYRWEDWKVKAYTIMILIDENTVYMTFNDLKYPSEIAYHGTTELIQKWWKDYNDGL